MRKIKLITDSCADLPKGFIETYDLEIIDFSIYLAGTEIVVDSGWKNISSASLYKALRDGHRIWTLPATIIEITTKFEKWLKEDYDIIYIGTAEKLSATISKARTVSKKLLKNYPDAQISVIDSLNASVGISLCVQVAGDLILQGKSVEEVTKAVEGMRNNVLQYATADKLTYLSKANKISARSASFGDLLKIKPILTSDAKGAQTAMGSVRGKEKSYDEIVRLFLENVIDPENQIVYIIHGDDLKAAKAIKDRLLASKVEFKGIEPICIGAVVGISIGPGMVGIFGLGKEVTFVGE